MGQKQPEATGTHHKPPSAEPLSMLGLYRGLFFRASPSPWDPTVPHPANTFLLPRPPAAGAGRNGGTIR